MSNFQQIQWDEQLVADCRALVQLALEEDLGGQQDWTTVSLVPAERRGAADVVAREAGVVAGLAVLQIVVEAMQADFVVDCQVEDGAQIEAGQILASLQGTVRDLLTAERTMLNLLSRLMGIATQARHYVAKIEGTQAEVYDTRKTTPGWRRLEKYASRCGGAMNHRTGLFDAILIKDNHLAQRGEAAEGVDEALRQARRFLAAQGPPAGAMCVEIEVDTLEQLKVVLPAEPDIVLLDNMSLDELREAVLLRDSQAPKVVLEASGGVRLETIREIAQTGVDRISVGALTHSARSLDIGLDWQ